ncbi:enterochelin esterase [Motilibacter aurantiacus]|uniref:enterochelin esterase n=1 Tax=Motilibacter aurantiacus TaxID=2714955 RepID=UPI00140E09F0|nr:enterochelin esterase [Motilibacter aurantiacus]NHC45398.1 enterochelin esterase [Motilibacter aurantiacus]
MSDRSVGLPAGSTPPRLPRPWPAPVCAGPRIATLRRELAHDPDAVERLWAEAAEQGTPLIGAVDAAGYCVVTFLWRGDAGRVLLLANKLTDRSRLEQSLMERVPGTDLWHLSYRLPATWRGSYVFVPGPDGDAAALRALAAGRGVPDPLNGRILLQPPGVGARSVAELPDAPAQPYLRARPGVRRGSVTRHEVASAAYGPARAVWAYTPAGHRAGGGPYPLLVLLDGEMWLERLSIVPTLDNLVAEGLVPPLVAVLPEAGSRQERFRDLSCSEGFAQFLARELAPWATAELAATADPALTVVAGQSLGGLAAAHAALHAPERLGAVLAQSGSWWWPNDPLPGPEAVTRHVLRAEPVPVRFFLENGTDEWVSLEPARRLRDALAARGYALDYREFAGGHDQACWRGGIAEGLTTLLSTAGRSG